MDQYVEICFYVFIFYVVLYQNLLYNDALTPLAALVCVAPGLHLGNILAARRGTASTGVLLLSSQTLLM